MEGQYLLRELYEQCYGIADHLNSSNPMELVLKQPNETIEHHEQEQNLVDQFAALDIYATFGVSFSEFKKLSIRESSLLIKSANKRKEQESVRAKKLEAETKKM